MQIVTVRGGWSAFTGVRGRLVYYFAGRANTAYGLPINAFISRCTLIHNLRQYLDF